MKCGSMVEEIREKRVRWWNSILRLPVCPACSRMFSSMLFQGVVFQVQAEKHRFG